PGKIVVSQEAEILLHERHINNRDTACGLEDVVAEADIARDGAVTVEPDSGRNAPGGGGHVNSIVEDEGGAQIAGQVDPSIVVPCAVVWADVVADEVAPERRGSRKLGQQIACAVVVVRVVVLQDRARDAPVQIEPAAVLRAGSAISIALVVLD